MQSNAQLKRCRERFLSGLWERKTPDVAMRNTWSSQRVLSQTWDTPQSGLVSQHLLDPMFRVRTQPHLLIISNPTLSESVRHQENRYHCISTTPIWKVNCGPKATLLVARESAEVSLLSKKGCSYILSSFFLSLITPPKMAQQNGSFSPLRTSLMKHKQAWAPIR